MDPPSGDGGGDHPQPLVSGRQVKSLTKIVGNPGNCFPTHPGRGALHRKSPAQTRCTVVATRIERPHRQVREVKRKGERETAKQQHAEDCGAKRVGGDEGTAENATPGMVTSRVFARSVSSILTPTRLPPEHSA